MEKKKKYICPEIGTIVAPTPVLNSLSDPNDSEWTDAKKNSNISWDDEWDTTSEDAWRVGYSNDFETSLPKVKSVWDD